MPAMTTSVNNFSPSLFRERGWWRGETLRDWLNRRIVAAPDQIALRTQTMSLTYAQFGERVRSFSAALQHLGICRGDIVAISLPNIPEFVISWLAINELGALMQTIHTPYGAREIEHLLNHSGAKACIAMARAKDRSPAGDIADLRAKLPALKFVIAVGGEVAGTESFEKLMALDVGKAFEPPAISADDKFMLLYTSGTTSSPKAVSVTYNHFLSNARMCAAEFGITAADRILCLAPFTHLYGLYTLELGFSAGATACLLDAFTPPAFVQALTELKPTMLFGGPAHISPCVQMRLLDGVDFSAMRVAVLSGSTVPPAVSAELEQRLVNGKVLQAWGMTELQFGACSRPTDPSAIRFGTIGRATPGTELRVADADGNVLAPGEIGELHVRGCSLFSGYSGNDEATRLSFSADQWFQTGDLARMDAQGNVELNGRTKELINRGGIKFNPVDMEVALSAHPSVAQVAIAPLPDPTLGERASCFVVLKSGATLDFDELIAFLAERKFAKFTWPEHLAIVTEMPMTPTRKVMKAELVRQYLSTSGYSQ
jgi:cyclohexanecarboxylate-CoA ligase/acyl-CoA synthetase